MRINLPQVGKNLEAWAKAMLVALDQGFATIQEPISGVISLWPDGVDIPKGWLECDGTEYDGLIYRGLAQVLPESSPGKFEVPNLTPPTGAIYIIRV